MKKIFLAASFSGQIDYATGEVLPVFRASVQSILAALREQPDVEVFCALEDEGWKLPDTPADIGVHADLARLDESDILVALVHDKPSAGVQFELGYAVAKSKQVVLAVEAGSELAYFNQGAVGAGLLTLVTYNSAADLRLQLPIAINEPEGPST